MRSKTPILLLTICGPAAWLVLRGDTEPPRMRALTELIGGLRKLHTELDEPQGGEWLAVFDESGQTFREYLDQDPIVATGTRRVIYIQPLGSFGDAQRRIVEATGDFLGHYFQLPVRVNPDRPLSLVPESARRRRSSADEQILTSYVLDELLGPSLPDDAAAMIALTAVDLWPGDGWNFVFGEASVEDRVGVLSLHRYGDPEKSEAAYRLALLRTFKTASHEIGHMFSMAHCTKYECNMEGSNSLAESDADPLALCPECLAKLCWATGAQPAQRFEELAAFYESHGLSNERDFVQASLRALHAR